MNQTKTDRLVHRFTSYPKNKIPQQVRLYFDRIDVRDKHPFLRTPVRTIPIATIAKVECYEQGYKERWKILHLTYEDGTTENFRVLYHHGDYVHAIIGSVLTLDRA